ncbi:MAG: hypothetical protein KIS92_11000 [Planctomycetota bacterium]|nr:hypothetical protein [Planctomycetota bacterium]
MNGMTKMALLLGMALALSAAANLRAEERAVRVQPIYETEKGWTFDKQKMLRFHNESPNPDGTRFLRWKGYTFVVTEAVIMCVDPRPYGTKVQGMRRQANEKGEPISDKDLMNDLKHQAENIREEKDPNDDGLPVNLGVGIGVGGRFRF